MLCGLICSYKKDNTQIGVFCYISAFLLIFLKSLCGYEYLTTLCISLVAFPLMDFFVALINKDKQSLRQSFFNVVGLGLCAVVGFCLAFLIHTYFLGNNSIPAGLIKQKSNAIRRFSGTNLSESIATLWGREFEAIIAGRFETFLMYFKWHTEIITGIPGNLFYMLYLLPILCFILDFKDNKLDIRFPILYLITFLAPASWFFIMKDHSYVHTHLNFILWYFGFVQLCFYIIIKKVFEFIKR